MQKNKKKIIIATHEYSGIYKNIIQDLECNNFEVFPLIFRDNSVNNYRSLKDRLVSTYNKKILKDKYFKKKLFQKYHNDDLINQIKKYPANYFDYAFFIRADFYSDLLLKEVVRVSKYKFSYHWDGLSRHPKILNKISYFDKFYVFEKNDLEKYSVKYQNIHLTDSFYFENNKPKNIYPKTDVFYIGEYIPNRFNDLLEIYYVLKKQSLNIKIIVMSKDEYIIDKYKNSDIQFIKNSIEYSETLEMSKSSSIVLDILAKEKDGHVGLSLRFFEALFHKNKIITDNINVLNYDFYHPDNIFIKGHDDINMLPSFIEKKYYEIEEKFLMKYSFINWMNSKISKFEDF
jgi:hypothetical protein